MAAGAEPRPSTQSTGTYGGVLTRYQGTQARYFMTVVWWCLRPWGAVNLPGTLGQTRRKPTSLEAKPCQAVPPSLPRTFSIPGGAWVGLFYWGCKSQLPGQFTFSEGLAHPFGPSEVCWEYPEASCSESPSQHVELAGSVDTGAGAEGFAGHGTLGPGRDQEWADATTALSPALASAGGFFKPVSLLGGNNRA